MSKSAGQKAYEAFSKMLPSSAEGSWGGLQPFYQRSWEAIAGAVTAPEPKSYGEVLKGVFGTTPNGTNFWELLADAVIAEFKRREGIK